MSFQQHICDLRVKAATVESLLSVAEKLTDRNVCSQVLLSKCGKLCLGKMKYFVVTVGER